MKTIGIIAEYNPFHNGHAYQIQKAKELTNADYVIVFMSGNFVQRGEPAFADKYTRTEMALKNGVDAIFEIPVIFSAASAEFFAKGAIKLINECNIIDYLCFGAETDNPSFLYLAADILVYEPLEFKMLLKKYLSDGISFPAAKSKALTEYITLKNIDINKYCFNENINSKYCFNEISDINNFEKVLNEPNNILAIEYLKALKLFNCKIKPLIIKREGANYHSNSLDTNFASASAIRNILYDSSFLSSKLNTHLPVSCIKIIKEGYNKLLPINIDDFSDIIYSSIIGKNKKEIAELLDINNDLAARMFKFLDTNFVPSEYISALKSKQYTYTRISRSIIHLLLSIKTDMVQKALNKDFPLYLRLLGFNADKNILNILKKNTSYPIIAKTAAYEKLLNEQAAEIFEKDIFASKIYNRAVYTKFNHIIKDDYRHNIVIINQTI